MFAWLTGLSEPHPVLGLFWYLQQRWWEQRNPNPSFKTLVKNVKTLLQNVADTFLHALMSLKARDLRLKRLQVTIQIYPHNPSRWNETPNACPLFCIILLPSYSQHKCVWRGSHMARSSRLTHLPIVCLRKVIWTPPCWQGLGFEWPKLFQLPLTTWSAAMLHQGACLNTCFSAEEKYRLQRILNVPCFWVTTNSYSIKITEDVELYSMSVSSLPHAHGHVGR